MKYILYLIFFVLLHFESLSIVGDLKISQVWKGLFIIYSLFSVNFQFKKNKILSVFWIIAFSGFFVSLINGSFSQDFSYNFRVLLVPFLLNYILLKPEILKKNTLEKISIFVIVSSLLYYFELILPITSSIILENEFSKDVGFVGFFQKPHGASSVFSIIAVTSFINLINNEKNRRLYLGIFIISVIFIFFTYVRSGLLALLIVILINLFRKSNQKLIKKLSFSLIILAVSFFYVSNNESIRNRVLDKTEFNQDKDYKERAGSSRLLIWGAYIKTYTNYNVFNKLIGTGEFSGKNKFAEEYGIPLIPHNGFIEVLAYRGVLGVILYLILFSRLWKLKFNNIRDELLNKSYIFFFLSFMFSQGVNLVYEFIFISIVISRSKKQVKISKLIQ